MSPHPGKPNSIKPMKTVIENDYDDASELVDDVQLSSNGHLSSKSTLKFQATSQQQSSVNQLAQVNEPAKSITPSVLSSGYGSQLLAATPVSEDDQVNKNGHTSEHNNCNSFDDSESISSHCTSADGSSSSNAPSHTDVPEWLTVDSIVKILPDGKVGIVKFVGTTHFKPGLWVGVELDTPSGKNDGSVNGVSYFTCKSKFGIFVRPDKCKIYQNNLSPSNSTSRTGTITLRSSSSRSSLNSHGKLPLSRK